MFDYYSEAVVLDAEPVRETDTRLTVFTKRYGKLVAKVKSARKITSKLAGHLQPGNVVMLRAVEAGGLQIVDALKAMCLPHAVPDLLRLAGLLHEGERDGAVWNALLRRTLQWREILTALGWDPAHAACRSCGKRPEKFHISTQEFFCAADARTFKANEVISL